MSEEQDCLQFRTLTEQGTAPDGSFLQEHRLECEACRSWEMQSSEVTILASSLPQFDVPESLTQKILNSVEEERRQNLTTNKYFLLPLSLVAFISLLMNLPLDNWENFASWIIGLVGILSLKLLLVAANQKSVELP
ncbi:MAG: hypothetical protein K2W82_06410 [Candidatus Obscuribacterales bacterium]|nr:hypothetical protein [Candidatus Obscuribacterales bacterium]